MKSEALLGNTLAGADVLVHLDEVKEGGAVWLSACALAAYCSPVPHQPWQGDG